MSRLPFELFLALRYLRPKRTFVSVITVISVIGVMLGVAVLIIVISVMTGFDAQLRDKFIGFSAHLKVYKDDDTLRNYGEMMRIISSNKEVKAVAPYILNQVMLKTQPEAGKARGMASWVRGVDPLLEASVSSLTTNIIRGEFNLEDETILLGSELARNLRVTVGDRVALYSSRHLEEMEKHRGKENEVVILPDDYTVSGIFDVGYFEYNANLTVTSLRNAQALSQMPGQVNGLRIMLHNPDRTREVRQELYRALGPDYDISDWTEDNSVILTALAVEKSVMFYILIFILIVAAFGIMNSQITFTVQKTREIGMMKALGATRAQIMGLFLGQSLVVGLVGVLCGLGVGMFLLRFRNEFLHFMKWLTHLELFPASIYGFTDLPALTSERDIALICVTALVICVLAGVAPAWSAGRLRPVEALRHE